MNDELKKLAIIPARKGSKGLPGKNIKPLAGKPLLAHTIEQAINSAYFDRVVVSTDSDEIAEIAREFGAETPVPRPSELAGDTADIRAAVNHLLDELAEREDYSPDIVALLFPTYPFRTRRLIEEIVDAACNKAVWAQCACPVRTNPAELVAVDGRQEWPVIKPLLEQTLVHPAAHASRRLLSLMGNIRAEVNLPRGVRQGDTSPAARMRYFEGKVARGDARFAARWHNVIVEDPVLKIDINYAEDLVLAEEVLREGLFDFERT